MSGKSYRFRVSRRAAGRAVLMEFGRSLKEAPPSVTMTGSTRVKAFEGTTAVGLFHFLQLSTRRKIDDSLLTNFALVEAVRQLSDARYWGMVDPSLLSPSRWSS